MTILLNPHRQAIADADQDGHVPTAVALSAVTQVLIDMEGLRGALIEIYVLHDGAPKEIAGRALAKRPSTEQ